MSEASPALPIRRVTVHRDGAIVERSGRLPVEEGRVAVRPLPLLLEEATLRAEVVGAQVREVRLGLELDGQALPEAPSSQAPLREAALRVATLEARLEVLREQRTRLVGFAPPAVHEQLQAPKASVLASWAEAEAEVAAWVTELDAACAEVQARLKEAHELLEVARHTSGEGRPWWASRTARRVAWLGLATTESEVEVTLSYLVAGACWTPGYALHTGGPLREGRLSIRALVAQATGEDWKGVTLALSTAPCRRIVELPDLPTLRLGRAQAPAPPAWRELPADLEQLFPDQLTPKAAPPPPVKRKPPPEPSLDDLVPPAEAPARPDPFAFLGASPPRQAASRSASTPRPGAPPPAAPASVHDAPVQEPPTGGPLEVEGGALDYPRLRLASHDAPPGDRGRLRPVAASQELAEAGLPPRAATWLERQHAQARRQALRLDRPPLPPHHHLPDPVDGGDFRYETAQVDVQADGAFHTVLLETLELALEVSYRAVPRLDPRAFRKLRATLPEGRPLLPGPVEVHLDGALVQSGPWQGGPGGTAIELGLGVEEGIKIARNVRYREESVGIFGQERRLHCEIHVSVASGLARAVEIELLDRLPTSTDDEVKVALIGSSPEATPFHGDPGATVLRGGLRQVVSLPAGGEGEATLHWGLTLGTRAELVGGDRRG